VVMSQRSSEIGGRGLERRGHSVARDFTGSSSGRSSESLVADGGTDHRLAIVSRLPLDIYPTLLHVVVPTTLIRVRNGPLPRS
jgi:hypothetical protein